MTAEEEVERLRRVAYGPGVGAAERAEAEAALRALAEQQADVAGVVPAVLAVDIDMPVSLESGAESQAVDFRGGVDEVDGDVLASIWARRIRVAWLVPIVAGALLVGVLTALATTGWFEKGQPKQAASDTPSATPTAETVTHIPGDLESADAWFDGPATASDAYSFPGLLQSNEVDPYDVRFALAGGDGWNVWVGRSITGKLCLLLADARNDAGAAGCFERARFAVGGAHLGMGDRIAHWYGGEVSTSLTTVSGPNAVPSPPGSGAGDAAAAATWFAPPDSESGTPYPYPDMLDALGIGDGDIRSIERSPESSRNLWIARQGETGFCLLTTDDVAHTSNYACAPLDEFLASGVSIATEGFAAYWDGESISETG